MSPQRRVVNPDSDGRPRAEEPKGPDLTAFEESGTATAVTSAITFETSLANDRQAAEYQPGPVVPCRPPSRISSSRSISRSMRCVQGVTGRNPSIGHSTSASSKGMLCTIWRCTLSWIVALRAMGLSRRSPTPAPACARPISAARARPRGVAHPPRHRHRARRRPRGLAHEAVCEIAFLEVKRHRTPAGDCAHPAG